MTDKSDIIEIEQSKFWIEDDVLFCEIYNPDENKYLEESTIDTYLKVINDLCKGKSMPFLIDFRNTKGTFLRAAAIKLSNSEVHKKACLCEVFLVNSLKMKLLIATYKRIYEPIKPFKIFENYNEASEYAAKIKHQ
ncbi:hypothetical protein [Mariniflexile sp.]|uniref:DUF7793 family protein n=1 Tax=Mariniflexile sp. TaxID=1979402 RepID=UPI0035659ECA